MRRQDLSLGASPPLAGQPGRRPEGASGEAVREFRTTLGQAAFTRTEQRAMENLAFHKLCELTCMDCGYRWTVTRAQEREMEGTASAAL